MFKPQTVNLSNTSKVGMYKNTDDRWGRETTDSSPGLVVENEEEGTATNRDIKHSCLAINLTLTTGMLP